jgi:hypothetical protein
VEFAQLYPQLGRHDQALPLFEQARVVHETAPGPDPVAHARCLQALAELYDARAVYVVAGEERGVGSPHATADPFRGATGAALAAAVPLRGAAAPLSHFAILDRVSNNPAVAAPSPPDNLSGSRG